MNEIQKAVKVLNAGGIVIYPTDTAFGIGCRIDKEDAIKRLFSIRNRPEDKAVPVLVNSLEMAKKYWASPIPNVVRRLANKYWPGGLTIVYSIKKDSVSPLAIGGKTTIGLRMPNHETPLAIIERTGVPLLGPSANLSGEKTPYSFQELDPTLVNKVDFVLQGETKEKSASTVIDCTQHPPSIIRQGAVNVTINEKIILYIDTHDNTKSVVKLEIGNKVYMKENSLIRASQNVLPLIESLLKDNNLTPQDLSEVRVHTGPGSFTGLRVGVTIANTLASQLKIPINGNKVGKYVQPTY